MDTQKAISDVIDRVTVLAQVYAPQFAACNTRLEFLLAPVAQGITVACSYCFSHHLLAEKG